METVKSNKTESREDNKVARKFISAIIGEEVIELAFSQKLCEFRHFCIFILVKTHKIYLISAILKK